MLTVQPVRNPSLVTTFLTCAGGVYVPAIVESLRTMDEPKVRIVGTDNKESIDNSVIFDDFRPLSHNGSSKNLGINLLNLCKETSI